MILESIDVAGGWMLPGGRADIGEDGETAFKREMKEELGINSFQILDIVDYKLWYTPNRHVPVCTIVNLVDIGTAEIKLSEEHSSFQWVSLENLHNYHFRWDKAAEIIRKGFELNQ